ncbi:MAG: hypothetical protein IJW16_00115 [Clostridia bacterium]|nr:hypothetical protein [Clostridia bacterium]
MSKKKLGLLLLFNTAVIVALYFVLVGIGAWFMTPIYIGLAAVSAIVFIFYNRGFYAAKATPEQLPNNMSHAEKQEYIKEGKERLSRSRWMITLIFPLILALAADMIYLYFFPSIQELFS